MDMLVRGLRMCWKKCKYFEKSYVNYVYENRARVLLIDDAVYYEVDNICIYYCT